MMAAAALLSRPPVDIGVSKDKLQPITPITQTVQSQGAGQPPDPLLPTIDSFGKEKSSNPKVERRWWTYVQLPDSSGWQAIFDGLLVGIGWLQWRIYRQIRRDSINSGKAMIFVKSINYFWLTDPTDENRVVGWRIVPVLENSGQRVARPTIGFTNFCTFDGPLGVNFDFPDLALVVDPPKFLVGPHSTFNLHPSEIAIPFLVAAQREMCYIYIWGWVEFYDRVEADVVRKLEFCNRVLVLGDPRSKDCAFSLPFEGRYNNDDEGCYYKPGKRPPRRLIAPFRPELPAAQARRFGMTPAELEQYAAIRNQQA